MDFVFVCSNVYVSGVCLLVLSADLAASEARGGGSGGQVVGLGGPGGGRGAQGGGQGGQGGRGGTCTELSWKADTPPRLGKAVGAPF